MLLVKKTHIKKTVKIFKNKFEKVTIQKDYYWFGGDVY